MPCLPPPPPRRHYIDRCITIIKGEPILTVENSYELIFFLSKQHCGKTWGRCYLGILGLSPGRSLTGFFRFPIWRRENGAEWQGSSGEGGRCSIFRTEKYFYYHRASNDRSLLSQSLWSVAGISHSRVRYFLTRG